MWKRAIAEVRGVDLETAGWSIPPNWSYRGLIEVWNLIVTPWDWEATSYIPYVYYLFQRFFLALISPNLALDLTLIKRIQLIASKRCLLIPHWHVGFLYHSFSAYLLDLAVVVFRHDSSSIILPFSYRDILWLMSYAVVHRHVMCWWHLITLRLLLSVDREVLAHASLLVLISPLRLFAVGVVIVDHWLFEECGVIALFELTPNLMLTHKVRVKVQALFSTFLLMRTMVLELRDHNILLGDSKVLHVFTGESLLVLMVEFRYRRFITCGDAWICHHHHPLNRLFLPYIGIKVCWLSSISLATWHNWESFIIGYSSV